MRVNKAALIAAVFMAAAFLSRSVVTLFASVSHNLTVVRGIVIVLILQVLSSMLFFIYFRSDYIVGTRRKLKTAAAWAIFAQVLLLIAVARDGLQIFGIEFLPEILNSSQMSTLTPFFPWVASLLLLIFFVVFFTYDIEEEKRHFKKVKIYGLSAGALSLLFQTVSGIRFLRLKELASYSEWSGRMTLAAAPFVLAMVLLYVLFLLSFYKGRDIF